MEDMGVGTAGAGVEEGEGVMEGPMAIDITTTAP
jgi:hypothetical protein